MGRRGRGWAPSQGWRQSDIRSRHSPKPLSGCLPQGSALPPSRQPGAAQVFSSHVPSDAQTYGLRPLCLGLPPPPTPQPNFLQPSPGLHVCPQTFQGPHSRSKAAEITPAPPPPPARWERGDGERGRPAPRTWDLYANEPMQMQHTQMRPLKVLTPWYSSPRG